MSKDLEQTISALSERVEGDVGVCAQTLCGSRRVAVNAGDRYPTASSVKMFILYTLLYETDRHRVSLAERIDYQPRFSTPGSGVMSHLDPGLRPTLKDLATLMMMISDNTATNILIDYLGLGRVNEAISDIPVENTRIGSWSNFKESDRDSFSLGESTPEAFTDFLLKMRTGALLSPQLTELFLGHVTHSKIYRTTAKIPACEPLGARVG